MTTGDAAAAAGDRAVVAVGRWWRAGDVALRLAGAVVSLAGGLVVAAAAVLAVPWRVDTWFGMMRLPLAVVFAVAGVAALLWFAPRATGTRWGVLLPAAGWSVVSVAAVVRTPEGSFLLMRDDVVAALTLVAGFAVVVAGAALTLTGGRAHPAGSGPPMRARVSAPPDRQAGR